MSLYLVAPAAGEVRRIVLARQPGDDQGTRGSFSTPGFSCHALELPDRNNRSNVSRILAGEYSLRWVKLAHMLSGYSWLYIVERTPGRTGILLHNGTVAGDVSKGYHSDSYGCILLGLTTGTFRGQKAIFNSRMAVDKFHAFMQGQPAKLIVEEVSSARRDQYPQAA